MTKITLVTPSDRALITYTKKLGSSFPDQVDTDIEVIEFDRGTASIIASALAIGSSETEIIHFQHEYWVFGERWGLIWIFYPVLWICSILFSISVVVTMHEVEEPSNLIYQRVNDLYIPLLNYLINFTSDFTIFLSEHCYESYDDIVGVDDSDVQVLPHGVYDKKCIPPNEAKKEFNLSTDDTIITQFGYIRPGKNYEAIIDIAENNPNCEFLIAGGSRNFSRYYKNIKSMKPENVTITGCLCDERFNKALAATDVALLPYTEASQSGILNWCLGFEIPAVASDASYFENMNSKYGVPLIFQSITEADQYIQKLTNDSELYTEVIKLEKEIKKDQSFERVAELHLELYRTIIE